MEANANFYILKYNLIRYDYVSDDTNMVIFTANSADYGGAVYTDDDTNPGGCTSDSNTQCFFQVLDIHRDVSLNNDIKTQSISFSHNRAHVSGSTLYGGLLDRCAVSQFAEAYGNLAFESSDRGIAYFKSVSVPHYFNLYKEAANVSISSDPVRVCLCINNKHNCTHQSHVWIKKGEPFTRSVVAVDQISQPVSAIIQTSLMFAESGVAEGQLARKIPAECTNLTFNVISPHTSENLTLYALDGPCKDADLSTVTIEIHFLPCSCLTGLQVSGNDSTNYCTCECHGDINQYVEHCDRHTGSLFKQLQSRAWISYINDTNLTAYLVYLNCPFDYCLVTSPPVDLNHPDGADVQCASTGHLCCVDLANLVLASPLVVHAVSHVLATGLHYS